MDCTNISGKHGIIYLETPLGVSVCAGVLPHRGVRYGLSLLLTACLHFNRKPGRKVGTTGVFWALQQSKGKKHGA